MCIEAMYWAWRLQRAGASPLIVKAIIRLELEELAKRQTLAVAHGQTEAGGETFHNTNYANGKTPVKSAISPTLDPRLFAREFSSGYMTDFTKDKIAKTALGAEKTVPWEQHKQTWRLLDKLRNEM